LRGADPSGVSHETAIHRRVHHRPGFGVAQAFVGPAPTAGSRRPEGGGGLREAFFEDPGRFESDAWGVAGSLEIPVGSEHATATAPTTALRLGASYVAPTKSHYRDPEAYAQLGILGRAPAGEAHLSALISGVVLLSQSGLDIGQRSLLALTLSGGLPDVPMAPELFLRLPLDKDLRDTAKAMVGVRLTF